MRQHLHLPVKVKHSKIHILLSQVKVQAGVLLVLRDTEDVLISARRGHVIASYCRVNLKISIENIYVATVIKRVMQGAT